MKKFTIAMVIIFALILSFTANAQLVSFGVGGGLTQVLGPDHYTTEVSEAGLGFSSEYNFGAVAKISLPLIPITPRAFVIYHKLSGNGRVTILAPGDGLVEVDREYSQSILSLGAGVQYGFIPIPAGFDPYLSLDATYNNFGDFSRITDGYDENLTDGFSRFGLQLGIGTEVTIIPMINVDVFVGYNWYNLTGKEDGEETVSSFVLDVFLMFNFL